MYFFFLIVNKVAQGRGGGIKNGPIYLCENPGDSSGDHQSFDSDDSCFMEFLLYAYLKKMTGQTMLSIFTILLSILQEVFN